MVGDDDKFGDIDHPDTPYIELENCLAPGPQKMAALCQIPANGSHDDQQLPEKRLPELR